MKKISIATIINIHNETVNETAIEIAKKCPLLVGATPTTYEIDTIVPVAYMIHEDGRVTKRRNVRITNTVMDGMAPNLDGDNLGCRHIMNAAFELLKTSALMKTSLLTGGKPSLLNNILAMQHSMNAACTIMDGMPPVFAHDDADFETIEEPLISSNIGTAANIAAERHPLAVMSAPVNEKRDALLLNEDDEDFDPLSELF